MPRETGTTGRIPVNFEDRPLDNEETSTFMLAWIGSGRIECFIDSGSSISVINYTEYEKIRSALLKPFGKYHSSICVANGMMMDDETKWWSEAQGREHAA